MKNEIERCGDFYIAKMSRGYAFKFDKVDLAIVLLHSWYPSRQGAQVYPTNRNGVTFHRLLFPETQEGFEIDHINRDSLDNRRCNLRICTHQQNQCNQDIQRNNTSGFSGVSFYPPRRKFRARIKYWNREIHLGYFWSIEEAVQARTIAEGILFGEYGVRAFIGNAPQSLERRVLDKLQPLMTNRVC